MAKKSKIKHKWISKKITKCRFCKTKLYTTFINLGKFSLANSFLTHDVLNQKEMVYPLHALVCDKCFLVQLNEIANPEFIFSNYAYFSSYSDTWLKHGRQYVEKMITRYGFNKKSQIVEIGSNDGYLLERFIKKGIPAFGLEPASNIAKFAINRGIPTRIKFFNLKTANELARLGLTADLLIANNVIAHVPNLIDFVKGMKILLNPSGIITLEFPHLLQLIKQNQFDTIYHEHYSYFSLLFIEKLFSSFNLVIFDVEELPTHGGSLRIYVKHEDDSSHTKSKNVSKLIQKENEFGLDKIRTYVNFSKKVEVVKQKLYDFVTNVKRQGKTIVAYGAPAKASILLNYCKIGTNFIDYTVDRNPNKQGLYLPGSQIPIKSPETIRTTRPDYVLILAWNLTNEIMSQMDYIRSWGGKFIIPIPKIQICS